MYNYSLGNLIGIDVQLGWDETVLKFVSNVTKIPVETHPDGVLHKPIWKIKDEVNETHGFPYPQPKESKYWLAYASFLGQSFNGNGTVCELTFEVLKEGASNLTLTRTQLSDPVGGRIPHKFISAYMHTHVPIGDVDGDRDVDIFDIVLIAGAYGSEEGEPRYNPNYDIDGDGDIDIFDIVIAASHYGESW
jgi:hypothetical protein